MDQPPIQRSPWSDGRVTCLVLGTLSFVFVCGQNVVRALPQDTATHEVLSDPVRDGLVERIQIPLVDGRISATEFVATLVERLGFDPSAIRNTQPFTFDVAGVLGGLQLEAIEQLTGGIFDFEVDNSALTVTVDRIELRRRDKEIRTRFREWLGSVFPEMATAAQAQYGVRVVRPNGSTDALHVKNASTDAVLLVHGLDDPGTVWTYLAPVLVSQGYSTLVATYPNDQPVEDSAAFLAGELQTLRELGFKRITIIAHSMGGLVARDVLTNPSYYAGDARGSDRFPSVPRLILLGTPNSGSPMAYLHPVGEARDQIVRAFSGDGLIFGSFFDGAGEAQVDLLPGSDFLTSLNSRPNPQHVTVTVIAGRASPISPDEVPKFAESLTSLLPNRSVNGTVESFTATLNALSEGIGDGCVSIESAKLAGIEDFSVVDGNHLTMIRNYWPMKDRVPPGVPIILDRLRADTVGHEDANAGGE